MRHSQCSATNAWRRNASRSHCQKAVASVASKPAPRRSQEENSKRIVDATRPLKNDATPSEKSNASTPSLEASSQRFFSSRGWRGWLPWSQQAVPLASKLENPSVEDDLMTGDGMAATIPEPLMAAATRRSRRRRSTGSSLEVRPVQTQHPTLQLLRQRFLSSSKPGARKDPFKLGLVVEGGGMRGCVSGGALQALADLGLLHVFDATYGSSAGAINLSYFLSGQRDGVQIYHEHIANEQFIDLRRLMSRRPEQPPALNLDMLLSEVMEDYFPLHWDAVVDSAIPLKVVASSLDVLRPVLLDSFVDKHDLREALRASATVPEVAGGPVEHRGHRLVDAAVFEAVPFRSAIADGCTHVLVLCTRPAPPARRSPWSDAFSDAFESAVKRAVLSPEYMIPAWKAELEALNKDGITQDEMLRRSLEDGASELPWFAGSHVYPVYPAASGSSFSPLCIDTRRIKAGVQEGRRSALTVARAALGDLLDFSTLVGQEAANIVPVAPSSLKRGVKIESQPIKSWREDYVFHRRSGGLEAIPRPAPSAQ